MAIGAAGLMAGPAPSPTVVPLGLEVVVEVRPGGAVSSQVTPLGDGPSLWAPDRPLFLSHSLGTSCKTPTWVSLGGSPALSSSCPSFWLSFSACYFCPMSGSLLSCTLQFGKMVLGFIPTGPATDPGPRWYSDSRCVRRCV